MTENMLFHNVERVVAEEEGIKFSRVPEWVQEGLSNHGKSMAYTPSGVELRFVLVDEKVTLTFYYNGEAQYSPRLYLYYGCFQGGWVFLEEWSIHQGYNEVVVERPKNIEKLRTVAKERGDCFSPDVMRISGLSSSTYFCGVEGEIRQPFAAELPQKSVIIYGSSITHGSLSQNINACYAALVGKKLNVDVLNKGLAGSCNLENGMVDYVLAQDADFYIIEAGTNCFSIEKEEWFAERVAYILKRHRELASHKKLFLIDCFLFGEKYERCNAIVSKVVKEFGDDQVVFISGRKLLPGESFLSADFVHPSIEGHIVMAENLSNIIRSSLR